MSGSGSSSSDDTIVLLGAAGNAGTDNATNKQRLLADVAACSSLDTSGLHAQHDDAEPLLTAVSSKGMRRTAAVPPTAVPGSQQQQQQQQQQQPVKPQRPPAPVRCRAAPVAVSFTQLETPHLPAREQREVEIKAIKRQAGQQVWRVWVHVCVHVCVHV
jgi:hypothetical protein